MSSNVASYKHVLLLPDYWSHLLCTVSTRLHVGICARSSIVISYECHTNMRFIYIYEKNIMTLNSEVWYILTNSI